METDTNAALDNSNLDAVSNLDMKTSNMQIYIYEPMFNKRFKLTCAHIKDSDEHAHLCSLIIVSDGQSLGSQGSNIASGGKLRL